VGVYDRIQVRAKTPGIVPDRPCGGIRNGGARHETATPNGSQLADRRALRLTIKVRPASTSRRMAPESLRNSRWVMVRIFTHTLEHFVANLSRHRECIFRRTYRSSTRSWLLPIVIAV